MKTLSDLDHLPLEPAIKAQVTALVQRLSDALAAKESVLAEKEFKIQALTYELAQYKRLRFGTKNEALADLQRDLFREDVESDVAAIEAELQAVQATPRSTVAVPRNRRPNRQPLPAHLPRLDHRHEPASCTCGQCGGALQFIRDEISEQLDVEPAKFFVHRHIRPQYACRTCKTVVAEPVAPALIDGGLAAIGLLVWVIISKYLDYLPLYRLEQIAQRNQVHLARSSLCEWVGQVGVAFQPLYERLIWQLLQGDTLLADETPVPQLDPGRGKTKKAYLWAYRSNDLQPGPRLVVYDYQTSRDGEHARQFLADWPSHLMVDDYSGYKALFKADPSNAWGIELACMAHIRRKFFELFQANHSPMAFAALEQIAELYAIEAKTKALTIDQRQQGRQHYAKPILKDLHTWLDDQLATTAPGGAAAKALNYALKRWPAVIRYADTGHLPIDNNSTENILRPIALGRKIFYSSVPNARENGQPLFKAYW